MTTALEQARQIIAARVEEIEAELIEAREHIVALETEWKELTGRKYLKAMHGTDSGYYAHQRKWNTEPCDLCKAAHASATHEREASRDERPES